MVIKDSDIVAHPVVAQPKMVKFLVKKIKKIKKYQFLLK